MSAEQDAPPPPPAAPPVDEQGRRTDGKFGPGNSIGKSTRFGEGESGNPDGAPKKALSVRALEAKARGSVETVFLVWEQIMLDPKASNRDKIRAGELLAAYGMGRPRQAITVGTEEGKPPPMVDPVVQLIDRMVQAAIAGTPVPRLPAIDVEATPVAAPSSPGDAKASDDGKAAA